MGQKITNDCVSLVSDRQVPKVSDCACSQGSHSQAREADKHTESRDKLMFKVSGDVHGAKSQERGT